ncbi:hypothetical protein BKA69DRAFT_615205 [Paraphysoderma sedebokerense]|nr:hypothetical protein BKA69DRAFT_615205 [Paraphysoderma sedebokerense]
MSDTSDEESIYGYEDEAIEKEALRSPKKLRTNQHPPVPPDEILKPIILKYFYRGHLSYDQVVAYLKKHENIYISKRTLERRLQSWGLRRRDQLDDETIKNWIKEEIVDGSQNRGYRAIYDQIILKHKVYVKR